MTESPQPVEPIPQESSSGSGRSIWVYVLIGLLVIVLLAIIGAIFVVASGPSAPPPAEDQIWQRIQESGVIRAGTSADYPPFEFYNDNLVIDGFDAALMAEVARELGLSLELTDFAFEGLPQAIQGGQIDSAIAALSVTEERQQVVSFSNIYYIGQDAILAQRGSDIGPILSAPEMAEYRIGVQKLTVYEDWIQTTLIDSGLMPAEQMFVYAKPEHAIDDLTQGRLDLVVMDFEPANLAVSAFEVDIVGSNLNQQRFAIALPQGAPVLLQNVNDALTRLQNSGVISQLANEYLGYEPEPLPTPTTGPTATVGPTVTPSTCIDNMAFVEDLNLPDNNLQDFPPVPAGEPFQKGWRIRNTGTCNWDDGYFIDYVRGDRMNGDATPVDGVVEPGQTYDMWVDLVAPSDPGQYVGFWQMFNDSNTAYGQTIWVAISSVDEGGATATPKPTSAPTATPEPGVTETPELGNPLQGNGYTVNAINGAAVLDGTTVDMNYSATDVSGTGGCNTYGASYLVGPTTPTTGSIAIGALGSSQALCEDEVNEQEAAFFAALQAAKNYNLDGSTLVLTDSTGTELVRGTLK